MATDAKKRMLKEGALIVHRKGFNATGVAEIVKAAGVPKGSFYFYFDSKEAFGLELIDEYSLMIAGIAKAHFTDETKNALERIRAFFSSFVDFFTENEFRDGCPIGNLCLEMGDISRPFQEKLKSAIEAFQEGMATIISQGQKQGEILPDVPPESIADFLFSGFQGALLQMKVKKSIEPYRAFETLVFDRMLENAG
jgi:TetR/AcrR family transcriptional repressor of nem operon